MSRGRLFFWLSALLLVNTLLSDVVRYTADQGLGRAVADAFGVNIIVWVAVVAALSLLAESRGETEPTTTLDWVVVALSSLAAILPTSTASAAALTGLGAYVYFTSTAESPWRRAAPIFLSVAVAIVWGRVALAVFSRTMLRIDSILVGLFGIQTSENQVFFARDPGEMAPHFLIAPGCSSLHSISMAVVFSTTVHGWFGIKPSIKSISVCLLAVIAVVTINVFRLAAFSYFPSHFDNIHAGWMASLIGWITVGVIVAIVGFGMRREILQQG